MMRLNQTINNPGLDMKAYMQPQCCQKKPSVSAACAGTKMFNMTEAWFFQH